MHNWTCAIVRRYTFSVFFSNLLGSSTQVAGATASGGVVGFLETHPLLSANGLPIRQRQPAKNQPLAETSEIPDPSGGGAVKTQSHLPQRSPDSLNREKMVSGALSQELDWGE